MKNKEEVKSYFITKYYYKFNFIYYLNILFLFLLLPLLISYYAQYKIIKYEKYNYIRHVSDIEPINMKILTSHNEIVSYFIKNYIMRLYTNNAKYIQNNYLYINAFSAKDNNILKDFIQSRFTIMDQDIIAGQKTTCYVDNITLLDQNTARINFFITIYNKNYQKKILEYQSNINFDMIYNKGFNFIIKQINITQL